MLRMMKTDKGYIQLYNTVHEDKLNIIDVKLVRELEEKFEYGYLKDLQYVM